VWLVAGKRIWFFPNILAEEASLTELFRFWPDLSKDDDPPPKWSTRLAFGALTGVILWVVIRHGPNEASRARSSFPLNIYHVCDLAVCELFILIIFVLVWLELTLRLP
jgi:hypothetical protein